MAYSSIDLVSAYLGGVTIDASSAISSADVTEWLDWADAEIDKITNSKYVTGTVSQEIMDYEGENWLRVDKRPIISVTTLEYNENPLGTGDASWVALSEGRDSDNDFIVYKERGEILFHGTRPLTTPQGVRITYTYGYATTPDVVKELATALVAQKYLKAISGKDFSDAPSNVSVGSISISGGAKGADVAVVVKEDIQKLRELVGTMDLRCLI